MDLPGHDIRLAWRVLAREKAFAFLSLLTLALCIGANAAIFSLLEAVLMRPLPFPQPGRLVGIDNFYPGVAPVGAANSVPDYFDRRALTDVFAAVAMMIERGMVVGEGVGSGYMTGLQVTPSFFEVLGVGAVLGRVLAEEEIEPEQGAVVVLSDGLWRERFGADPGVIGRSVTIDGEPHQVVGVMPAGFSWFEHPGVRLWKPLAPTLAERGDEWRHRNRYRMIGRLADGVALEQAQVRLAALDAANLERVGPLRDILQQVGFHSRVRPVLAEVRQSLGDTLTLLQVAVLVVLVIGCVNIGNLTLGRCDARARELAIRFALGAGRWAVFRQMLTESLLLAVGGGALGLLVAVWAVDLVVGLSGGFMPRVGEAGLSVPVFLFTFILATASGVLVGVVPAMRAARRPPAALLSVNGRMAGTSRGVAWSRRVLAVVQVALAFVLLVCAGLFLRSLARVFAVDPGFDRQRVWAAAADLPTSRYRERSATVRWTDDMLERIRSIPGVEEAGVSSFPPFSPVMNTGAVAVEGSDLGEGDKPPTPLWNTADAGFFRALGIPLLTGRLFGPEDTAEAAPVALVDEALAARCWPGESPLGRRLTERSGPGEDRPWITVVGVVGTIRPNDVRMTAPDGTLYLALSQHATGRPNIVLRTSGEVAGLVEVLARHAREVDAFVPLHDVEPLEARFRATVAGDRGVVLLLATFAGVAVFLAGLGVYGVLAAGVGQRRRELGIRMAVGARAGEIVGMVVRHAALLIGAGLAGGIVLALAVTHAIRTALYEVGPLDPGTFLGALLFVALAGLGASVVPAWRAANLSPCEALREE